MMHAVFFREHGGVEKLEYGYQPKPIPGHGEALVQVKACALNHLDIWTRQGMPGVKIHLPHILGCDIAGVVVKTGHGAHGIPVGKKVVLAPGFGCGRCHSCRIGWDSLCDEYKIMGFQINGGYAEYVKAPARNLIPISKEWTFEEWASVPLVFLTAWHMLVTRAGLKKGESVLIHAAGSGVGSAAIQIAKYLGARVFTTVGSDEKIKRAKALGADEVINYERKDFSLEIKHLSRGRGVDVVFEHIGPATFAKSLASLARKGRLVTCGVTSGPMVNLDLRFLFVRQLSVFGSYMGGIKELHTVLRLVRKKKLRPVVDKVFPLNQAREAQARMLERQNFGKIVLTP
jgi:NADPH:quinone reductase-like Zn-dependent oxidoreductase